MHCVPGGIPMATNSSARPFNFSDHPLCIVIFLNEVYARLFDAEHKAKAAVENFCRGAADVRRRRSCRLGQQKRFPTINILLFKLRENLN
jgi:hypothetical protein